MNLNFFEFMKEVFCRVGNVVCVFCYCLDLINVCKWFSVIMDGVFYFVFRKVIDLVYLCCDCEVEVMKLE